MTHLLHIDTSITGENSVSRTLSRAAVERLKGEIPGLEVQYRDLVATPVGHLTGMHLSDETDLVKNHPVHHADVSLGITFLEEFLASDVVVIGVALYNFTVPSQLKAWVDRILVTGKTFRYTDSGPEGLMGDKRVILAVARGGIYETQSSMAAFEHAESYLRCVFAFMGVKQLEVIIAEGLAISPQKRSAAIQSALEAAATLTAA